MSWGFAKPCNSIAYYYGDLLQLFIMFLQLYLQDLCNKFKYFCNFYIIAKCLYFVADSIAIFAISCIILSKALAMFLK